MHVQQTYHTPLLLRPADRGSAHSSSARTWLKPVLELAAAVAGAPFIFVEVRTRGARRFRAGKGLGKKELRNVSSLCRQALSSQPQTEICEPSIDERLSDQPFIRNHPGIRFLAAATVRDAAGGARATVCILDVEPRSLQASQSEALPHLATLALQQAAAQQVSANLAQAQGDASSLRQEIRRTEHRHASVLSSLHEVVWETDVAGRVTYLSPSWTTLTHFPPEAGQGSPLSELIHSGDRRLLRSFFDHLARNSTEAPRLQIRYRKADGGFSWAELRARQLVDAAGSACGFRGSLLDISDRKQIEAALDLSESRFRAIFERAAIGILFVLPDGRALTANPAALRMLGRSELELKARPLLELMPEQARSQWEDKLTELLSGERDALHFGSRFLRKSPVDVEVDVQANVVRDEVGRPLFAVMLLKDVTEARRAEEELVTAKQRAEEIAAFKSSLLDNINHELRTPLATILGFASILIAEVTDDQREFIGLIQKAGERLTDTLNGVMDLARLEAGELASQPELLHVQDEVQDLVVKMTPSAQEKALALSVNGPEDPLYVTGDRSYLHRILKNLISNAVKFTAEGGINVLLEADAGEVRLHVQDTGTGMSEGFLSILFDEFRQESAGIARTHEGAGLGLSITKRLVERMGGRISVASTKGTGSTFTVHLPRTVHAG